MRNWMVMLAAAAAVAGCAGSEGPGTTPTLAPGSTIEGSFPFHRSTVIPLPPGPWRVISDRPTPWSDASGISRSVVLLQERDGRADRFMFVGGTLNQGSGHYQWNITVPCRRGAFPLKQEIKAALPQDQDCFGVGPFGFERRVFGRGGAWGEIFDEADRRPGWLPETALAMDFTFVGPTDGIGGRIVIDPRGAGVDASGTEDRRYPATRDWEPARISPQRRALADRMIAWSEAAQPVFRAGWQGRVEPLPPLP